MEQIDLRFYNEKRIVVTGGTGSIGSEIVKLLDGMWEDIIIHVISRDEAKQQQLRAQVSENVTFEIGDIRRQKTIELALANADVVIHTAAMKHVDLCDKNAWQAVLTNLVGFQHIKEAAILHGVQKVVILSSDKAANPVGVMGATKFIQEHMAIGSEEQNDGAEFVVARLGNVIGSSGSVAWKFKKQVEAGEVLTLTNPSMIRYFITPKQAAEFVLWVGANGEDQTTYVRQMPCCSMETFTRAFSDRFMVVGARPGEKIREDLLSEFDKRHCHIEYIKSLSAHVATVSLGTSRLDDDTDEDYDEYINVHLSGTWLTVDQVRDMLKESGVLL